MVSGKSFVPRSSEIQSKPDTCQDVAELDGEARSNIVTTLDAKCLKHLSGDGVAVLVQHIKRV